MCIKIIKNSFWEEIEDILRVTWIFYKKKGKYLDIILKEEENGSEENKCKGVI